MTESTTFFHCRGQRLLGILHSGAEDRDVGVLVVVGGPQYRVGSHRQFALLARAVAEQGTPVFRFDYTGMGDSEGPETTFEKVQHDIKAAVDEFFRLQPQLDRVVLWGLCDGASAAMMYGASDTRVTGMVLLNPWFRTEGGLAEAYLRSYYLKRLFQKTFWQKLLSGKMRLGKTLGGFAGNVRRAAEHRKSSDGASEDNELPYWEKMRLGMSQFPGRALFVLSGSDLTAQEFVQQTKTSRWQAIWASPQVSVERLEKADHTFSSTKLRGAVEKITCNWIMSI